MMFNRFKIFVFLLVAGFLFLTTAGPALAQFDTYHKALQAVGLEKDPAKDPLCWQEKVCYTALQQQFPDAEITKDNWQSPGPNNRCGSDLGVCLPAGTTQLEIKIGQVTEAKDLGDYIKKIYIYLLSIGGIVAAVLLIKGGADWMLSVGESEGIKNAQATIAGALTGLLLLLGSYVLLYTINPDLVNLKLPQVYMVRPAELVEMSEGAFCRTQGPLNAACVGLGAPNEYTCRPFHVLGQGPFIQLFKDEPVEMAILMTSAVPGGGVAGLGFKALGKVAGWAVKPIGKVLLNAFGTPAQKIMQSWASLGAKKIATEIGYGGQLWEKAMNGDMALAKQIVAKDVSGIQRKLFGQAVATTFREGWVLSKNTLKAGGILIGGGATYVVSGKMYDILKGNNEPGEPGLCDKTMKLPEASLCNAVMKPSDCASGTCVAVVDMYGWSTNLKIGVCSPGGAGNPCNKVEDCGTDGGPFKCIYNECTDFTFGRTCEEDEQCKNDLKCLMGGDGKKRCKSEEAAGVGGSCQTAAGQGDTGKCQDGLDCLATPSGMSASYSVCTDHQINSPCYKDEDCTKDSDYFVICAGSKLKGQGQNQFVAGKCLYSFFNANYDKQGMEISSSNASDVSLDTIGCTANNDCPNSQCWETYQGNKICAGP